MNFGVSSFFSTEAGGHIDRARFGFSSAAYRIELVARFPAQRSRSLRPLFFVAHDIPLHPFWTKILQVKFFLSL